MKVATTLWGEPVEIDEVEVHISSDGRGRVAVVRTMEGHFCIYDHWRPPDAMLEALSTFPREAVSWRFDKTPLEALYQDCEPRVGLYGTLDDARREVRYLLSRFEETA